MKSSKVPYVAFLIMMALLPATLALAITAAPVGKIALVDLDTAMIGMASQVTQAL